MSSIINKVKDALHGDNHKEVDHNAPEGTHGPHSSRVANAADPRVDSDRDGSHNMGAHRTAGHGEYGSGTYGTGNNFSSGTGVTGGTYGTGTSEQGVHGPHGSRVANTLDPRVDSDRDGSRTVGTGSTGYTGTGTGTGGYTGTTGTTGAGTYDSYGSTGTGAGYGQSQGYGAVGSGGSGVTGMAGPHGSRIANAADPRVDSDRDGRGAIGTGPGPAPNTAGPHKNDMLNKVDPRVDSDMDGSRTVGGNQTYQSGSGLNRDPTDASQVPPSVLRQHIGEPTIAHDDHGHHRERRNSVKTHQETFRGI
ncbi:hypothetical protein QBC46DRAFT_106849 [Diplogelasinospora grovesii]|uniref:Uncharacterized protein n=1 Tax=Diplogelasinospora grovesii TaxID=303347 RepID=A0AAN6S5Z1_9PEZI|nr:hypothetical protein QBC46DRAFT_106849 [Diplogelasinospora grovesii]